MPIDWNDANQSIVQSIVLHQKLLILMYKLVQLIYQSIVLHQELLILMYKLVQLIYTLTVHRCLEKTISLIWVYYFSWLLILKTTYGHLKVCIFCDQTHGRSNQLPIKIFFPLSNIMEQIMTGPSGNRLSICPLRFRIASPRVSIDRGAAEVILNLSGANRSAYHPRDQSLFV